MNKNICIFLQTILVVSLLMIFATPSQARIISNTRACESIRVSFDHVWEVYREKSIKNASLEKLKNLGPVLGPSESNIEGYTYSSFAWYTDTFMTYQEALSTNHPDYKRGDRTYVFAVTTDDDVNCLRARKGCTIGVWRTHSRPGEDRQRPWYREIECHGPRYSDIRFHQYDKEFLSWVSQYRNGLTGSYRIDGFDVYFGKRDRPDIVWFVDMLMYIGFSETANKQGVLHYASSSSPYFSIKIGRRGDSRAVPYDLEAMAGL